MGGSSRNIYTVEPIKAKSSHHTPPHGLLTPSETVRYTQRLQVYRLVYNGEEGEADVDRRRGRGGRRPAKSGEADVDRRRGRGGRRPGFTVSPGVAARPQVRMG